MKKETSINKLTELRGIGDTVAGKLIDYYGSETAAIHTIAEGQIFSLIEAGLSEKIALKIVRSYKNVITGEDNEDTLQTVDINQIYLKLIKIIQNYAFTTYGKSKILVDFYPTKSVSKITQNQRIFEKAQKITNLNKVKLDLIQSLLRDLKPLENVDDFDIKPRILLTTVPETIRTLKGLKIPNYCPVELIRSVEELQNYITSEELILLLTEHDIDESYYSGILALPENSLENPWVNIIPEKIMNFFMKNFQILKKVIDLSKTIELSDELTKTFPNLSEKSLPTNLQILENNLKKITNEGSLREDIDPELKRLKYIIDSFENESYQLQAELNERINLKIEKLNIQLEGKKVLEILKAGESELSGNNLREMIDNSVSSLITTEISTTKNKLGSKLKIQPEEFEFLENIFSSELQIPIEMNQEAVELFLSSIIKKYNKQEFLQLSKMASSLENFRPLLEGLVTEVFELDFLLALGRFSTEYNLKLPNFVTTGTGLLFKNALNIFLTKENLKNSKDKKIVPVTYQIGTISSSDPSRIIILSGANSGGKTSILQLITQMLILSHMGLGVPAEETYVSYFENFYYYQKPTGSSDAGAFETALKNFAEMVLEKKNTSKFILADEMEAISEPEASARVISAFLDQLQEQERTCGIFVSHLADQISKFSDKKIRIDGIEATGLDENLDLIVDRNPKINYHARSTPQLIVESLIKKSKNQEQEFYKKILGKFNKKL